MKNLRQIVFAVVGLILILACIILIAVKKKNNNDRGDVVTEKTNFSASEINTLKMQVGACQVEIVEGNSDSYVLSLEGFQKDDVTASVKDGVLTIRRDNGNSWNFNLFGIHLGGRDHDNERMILSIPKGTVLKEAECDFGAAKISVDTLHANDVKLTIGAGECKVSSLIAGDSAKITVGAGSLQVSEADLHNADMTCGVGELRITGKVTGKNKAECGVGELNLRLRDVSEDDFFGRLDCGLGSLRFGGETIKGSGKRDYGVSSAANELDAKCGVGEVDIRFE